MRRAPLRLRTHFSSRFFSRLASMRSKSDGMIGRARRANKRSICKKDPVDRQTDATHSNVGDGFYLQEQ